MKDIEFKISQFIDNELSDAEQKDLFGVLAEDQKARQMLADYMKMKKDTSTHYKNINAELAPLAVNQPYVKSERRQSNIYKLMFYCSAAAAVILLMLMWWNQEGKGEISSQYSLLKAKYFSLEEQYAISMNWNRDIQEKNIVPTVNQLNIRKSTHKHEIIFTSNTKSIRKPNTLQTEKYLAKLPKITAITISKEDFIGGQIVGN
jgi:hypothetical protein